MKIDTVAVYREARENTAALKTHLAHLNALSPCP